MPKLHQNFVLFFLLFVPFLPPFTSASFAQENVPESKQEITLTFAPIVKKVVPAVVNINASRIVAQRRSPFMRDDVFSPFFRDFMFGSPYRRRVEQSLGSGFIVSEDGLIVTNSHVVKNTKDISATLSDQREYPAELILLDEASDLALLQIKFEEGEETKLPYLSFAPSDQAEVGDLVLAIGNPFGVGQSVTSGIISALSRSTSNINDFDFFIQTDAAINPGNSGGPLIDVRGKVVGVNTAIYSRDGGSLGIGFAIPSEMVSAVISAAKSGQRGTQGVLRPWMGFETQNLTSDIARSLDLATPRGALVVSVHPQSPAAKAGLISGDLITALNGHSIANKAELMFRFATLPINQTSSLKVARQGAEKEIKFTVITPPETPARDDRLLKGNSPLSGATISNISPALDAQLGLRNETSGIVISAIEPYSTAARIGFSVGDVLISFNKEDLTDTRQAQEIIERQERGNVWQIRYRRDGRESTLTIR